MSKIISGYGCVVKINKGKNANVYRIEGMTDLFGNEKAGLIVLDDVQEQTTDIVTPVVATDNFRVLYSFGTNFGTLSVSGTIYMGNAGEHQSAIARIKEAFNKLRVSSRRKPVNVSVAKGKSNKVYFMGMNLGQVNKETQSIRFTMNGLVAEPPRGSK